MTTFFRIRLDDSNRDFWKGPSFEDAARTIRELFATARLIELRCGSNRWASWQRGPKGWRRIVAPRGQENLRVYEIKASQ